MTKFGHKLNYVINTFVKRSPGGHLLGKSCYVDVLLLMFYFTPSKMCAFLSHLVSRAGSGIQLYRFLFIAFSST